MYYCNAHTKTSLILIHSSFSDRYGIRIHNNLISEIYNSSNNSHVLPSFRFGSSLL